MIVLAIIGAGVVLELGLLCAAYRQGRIAGARPWQHPGRAHETRGGFIPVCAPGQEAPKVPPARPPHPRQNVAPEGDTVESHPWCCRCGTTHYLTTRVVGYPLRNAIKQRVFCTSCAELIDTRQEPATHLGDRPAPVRPSPMRSERW